MKSFKTLLVSFTLVSVPVVPSVYSCDLCAVHTARLAAGEGRPGLFAALAEQSTHFGSIRVNGVEVSNPGGQRMDSSITQAVAGWTFGEHFQVQASVPLIYRTFKRIENNEPQVGVVAGVGDIVLSGDWSPWFRQSGNVTGSWDLLAGIKLPTGSSARLREETQEGEGEESTAIPSTIHGHDLTLGSGSVDGIVGTSIFLCWNRWYFDGSAQYAIRTDGAYDYRFANGLTWNAGVGRYLWLEHRFTVALEAVVSGDHKDRDTFRGAAAEDTGITTVYVGPQISATWRDWLTAEVGVDLPVSIQNTALQSVPDYRIRAGISWRF